MRILPLGVAILAAAASCSTDGADERATAEPDGGAVAWPPSAADFCAAAAPRWCAAIEGCCGVPVFPGDDAPGFRRAGCEQEFVFQCEREMENVERGTKTFSAERFDECLEGLAPFVESCELSLEAFTQLQRARQPCDRVFNGTLDVGAPCGDAAAPRGVESSFELTGGPCRQPDDLGLAATCAWRLYGDPPRCETHALLSDGDPCAYGDDCSFGATCSAPPPCPDDCGAGDAGPLAFPCPPGCLPAGASPPGECRALLGTPCEAEPDPLGGFIYVDGTEALICKDGTFEAAGGPGAPCQSDDDCQDTCLSATRASPTCENGDRCECSVTDRSTFIDRVDCGALLRCGDELCSDPLTEACCTEDGECGAKLEGLESLCLAPTHRGIPDPACPDEAVTLLSSTLPDDMIGCCRPDGACGLASLFSPRLGCVPRETLGHAPRSCTPPTCGGTVCLDDDPVIGPTTHCCTAEGSCGLSDERLSGGCFDRDQPGSRVFGACPVPAFLDDANSCCRPDGRCGVALSPSTCVALSDAGLADVPCTLPEAP